MMPNELWIYDVIGAGLFEEGVTAKGVRDEVARLDKKEPLLVRMNSPGGYVREAVAIMSILSQWEPGVDFLIEGLAASCGSYIPTIGRRVQVVEGSMIMIHDPSTIAMGTAKDMRDAANYLDKSGGEIAKAYAKRTGKDLETIQALMAAETWFTADEAVEFGLADEKVETVKAAAFKIPEAFNFKHPPQPAASPQQRPANKLAAMQRQLDLAKII
jgi:ATP-dependent Clp protease protease subunit